MSKHNLEFCPIHWSEVQPFKSPRSTLVLKHILEFCAVHCSSGTSAALLHGGVACECRSIVVRVYFYR
eukprot:6185995-Pleurochrysis_carterae.AAC.5